MNASIKIIAFAALAIGYASAGSVPGTVAAELSNETESMAKLLEQWQRKGQETVEEIEKELAQETTEIKRFSEFLHDLPGHKVKEDWKTPQPHTYIDHDKLPTSFNWYNIDGVSYLTKQLNQHIPQYCGSCWAHAAMSMLADRIKIHRKKKGIDAPDINLSVQAILNCGAGIAGSCHGGTPTGVFELIKNNLGHVPYDSCQPYMACSADSTEGFCPHGDWTCKRDNLCRTCSSFTERGGKCTDVDYYPNASIAEYGFVSGEKAMMAEIYARGPISCGVDSEPMLNYKGGIIDNSTAKQINHMISVVGWGVSDDGVKYWIGRQSWGEYYGENMGYFRVKRGEDQLAIESVCSWATLDSWTEHNKICFEDGSNCHNNQEFYVDPYHNGFTGWNADENVRL